MKKFTASYFFFFFFFFLNQIPENFVFAGDLDYTHQLTYPIESRYKIRGPELKIEKGSLFLLSFKFEKKGEWPINRDQSHLQCDDQQRPFFFTPEVFGVYIPVAYAEERKKIDCSLVFVTGQATEKIPLTIQVKNKNYIVEKLQVKKNRVLLSKKNLQRVAKETAMLKKIYNDSAQINFFHEPFVTPMQSSITSFFGTKRLYNNIKQSSHMGVDFRSKVGTQVYAANAGRIVYVGHLFFTGNTILIDHGVGIFSIYAHLSKFLVKKGDVIGKNNLIALSGATGRVSGPHLHWAVKIWGHWIDGLTMAELGWPMSTVYPVQIVNAKENHSKGG